MAQTNLVFLRFVLTGCLLHLPATTTPAPIIEKPVDVVIQLYRDFSPEVVIDSPMQNGLWGQHPKVWAKYFSKQIVQLYTQVQYCERNGDICVRELSPIWYSQDPGNVGVKIQSGTDPSLVNVTIQYPVNAINPGTATLVYHLKQFGTVWKISDIAYKDGTTLIGWLLEGVQK
jgi:hypothetical protein